MSPRKKESWLRWPRGRGVLSDLQTWGPRLSLNTLELRIGAKACLALLPQAQSPIKEDCAFVPRADVGPLCLSTAVLHVYFNQTHLTVNGSRSHVGRDSGHGLGMDLQQGRAVCTGRVRGKFSDWNPCSLVSLIPGAQFSSLIKRKREKCFVDDLI